MRQVLPPFLLAILVLGCLRPEVRTVQLRPAGPAGPVPLAGAKAFGVRIQVLDQRPLYERKCGESRDKVANDTNPLGESRDPTYLSDRSLEVVFREAVEKALQALGFREGQEGDRILTLTLTHFYGEIRHYTFVRDRVEAGLELTVALQGTSGHTLFTGPVKTQVVFKPIKDPTLAVQAAMERTIERGVAALVGRPEFRSALLRGPAGPASGSAQPFMGNPIH